MRGWKLPQTFGNPSDDPASGNINLCLHLLFTIVFQVDEQSSSMRKLQRNLDETMAQNDNLVVQVEHLQARYDNTYKRSIKY